jgi:hypothetical protein
MVADNHGTRVNWMLKATILSASVPVGLAYSVVSPILAKMSDELAHDATDAYFVKMILGVIGAAMVVEPLSRRARAGMKGASPSSLHCSDCSWGY